MNSPTTAPAAMPTDEQIEAEILPMTYDGADLTECVSRVRALFAPILAGKDDTLARTLQVVGKLHSRALAAEAERDAAILASRHEADMCHQALDWLKTAEVALAAERERCVAIVTAYDPILNACTGFADEIAEALRAQGE